MSTSPYRCALRVTDNESGSEVEFHSYTGTFDMSAPDDGDGIPQMGAFRGRIECWTPLERLPFSSIQTLFEMAHTIEHGHLLEVQIRFFADESLDNVLCSYTTSCWMNRFRVTNVVPQDIALHTANRGGADNNWLHMEFAPSLSDDHPHHFRFTLGN